MIVCGIGILSFYGYKRISRELYLRKLLNSNINFEIPRLNINVPVLEGTDAKALQVSAGHFEGTGALGKGNYCIAGHTARYMLRYSMTLTRFRSAMRCISLIQMIIAHAICILLLSIEPLSLMIHGY